MAHTFGEKDAPEPKSPEEIVAGFSAPRSAATGTEGRVCQDIADRQRFGLGKYGVSVQDNPLTLKQWLTHAYEECLDQAVYLKRAIEELEK